jgi:hypothetical protein
MTPAAAATPPPPGPPSAPSSVVPGGAAVASHPPRFEFDRDTFAFANQLHWAYHFDPATGRTTFRRRRPAPTYAHRCFVLIRAARQFLYHARFAPELPAPTATEEYRRAIRAVMARSPRVPCAPERRVVFPGFAHLREFSRAHEALLQAHCGGAWQSYVLRSHWRMVFPISRAHQARTADGLLAEIRRGVAPLIHLVRFPQLTINHGMVLFAATETDGAIRFQAYDPNEPARPAEITFARGPRVFSLPANEYWAGGELDVIEIYRGWLM